MATTIKMPQLGESVTEGTIERWLVKEGDKVEQYDPLFEVVTDKVNAEVPAEVAGTVTKIIVGDGQTVKVGTPLADDAIEGLVDGPEVEGRKREGPSFVIRMLRVEHAIEGELHRVGVEWCAVMEGDPLSKLERVGLPVLRNLP